MIATPERTEAEIAVHDPMDREFKEDLRKTNPSLHMLYTVWALKHLRAIQEFKITLAGFGNLNTLNMRIAVNKQYAKLIEENAAYAQAHWMLDSIGITEAVEIVKLDGAE